MSLRTGSQLGRYRLLRDFVAGGNCRWTFAESERREFFVKEFQRPKFPPDSLPPALKAARLARCRRFEDRHERLLNALCEADGTSGALVVPTAFFREGLAYYHVAPRIAPASPSQVDIARLGARARLTVIRGFVRAVAALHARGLVHGDLKPSNVMMEHSAEGAVRVRLIDFDGSYFVGESPDPDDMEFDQSYMAPEVLDYLRPVFGAPPASPGVAADIFSLGLLVHEYWTGRCPASADAGQYAAEAVQAGNGLRLETADMDPALDGLVRRALAADPAARPGAREIDTAIGGVLNRYAVLPPEAPPAAAGFAERSVSHGKTAGPDSPGFSEHGLGSLARPGSFAVVIRKSRNLQDRD